MPLYYTYKWTTFAENELICNGDNLMNKITAMQITAKLMQKKIIANQMKNKTTDNSIENKLI